MSSDTPQEETTGVTKLEWSDDDDFFGDDDDDDNDNNDVNGTMDSSDGGWGDSYDVGDDEMIESPTGQSKPMEDCAEDEPEVEIADNNDYSEPTSTETEKVSDDEEPSKIDTTGDDEHEHENEHETGEATMNASPAKIEASPIPPRGPSPIPLSSANKPPLLPTDTSERVPRTPNVLPSLSDLMQNSGRVVDSTPLSLSLVAGTPGTPFVEIVDEDEKFEDIVRQRNRVRKEREDYHIAHIKVQMGRLEYALAAETKRRVDATTALDELARTQVHEMEERVREQLQEENEKLQSRLTALEERVRRLEENWAIDANRQIDIVNSKASDIGKAIARIQEDQDMERKSRLKREGILLRQVEEHAKETEERWNAERKDRVERLKELEDSILRNEARLALEQRRYEDRLDKELTLLKEELSVEIEERQTQDEQIVAALNRYTQQLQHSLSILSSD